MSHPVLVPLFNRVTRGYMMFWKERAGDSKIKEEVYFLIRGLLLLLLSCFSRVRLCATPETAAHQAPLSLGFSRQEHWSGLPFPSPMHESEKSKWNHSVVSDSSRPHGLQPTRLLRPWDFPGKSTGVGCHCLLHIRGLVLNNGWDLKNIICNAFSPYMGTIFSFSKALWNNYNLYLRDAKSQRNWVTYSK